MRIFVCPFHDRDLHKSGFLLFRQVILNSHPELLSWKGRGR